MVELGSTDFWQQLAADPALLASEVATIDLARMDETLQTHASLVAWVNATYELARVEQERWEFELTKARAMALLAARAVNDVHTQKAKIQVVLEAEVETNTNVVQAQQMLQAQKVRCGALRAMSKALDHRQDMLVQIAAKQRREWDSR